jgi:mRNA-degrading endonuclease toxin of MazEF toxin-antitoxin module
MNRGDVVEVFWQYTDMSGGKRRPAVVVQGDFLNGLIDDTILVQITSTRHSFQERKFSSIRRSKPRRASVGFVWLRA